MFPMEDLDKVGTVPKCLQAAHVLYAEPKG